MKLIGIAGKKRSGKDTFATMLGLITPGVKTYAFGNRMKEICSAVYGVPMRVFHDQSLKESPVSGWGSTPREMMTGMDRVIKDSLGEDFFVRAVSSQIQTLTVAELHSTVAVVTDVRFPVEADWIVKSGGIIVEVIRPEVEAENQLNHASEAGIPKSFISKTINNTGTLAYLFSQAEAISKDIRG